MTTNIWFHIIPILFIINLSIAGYISKKQNLNSDKLLYLGDFKLKYLPIPIVNNLFCFIFIPIYYNYLSSNDIMTGEFKGLYFSLLLYILFKQLADTYAVFNNLKMLNVRFIFKKSFFGASIPIVNYSLIFYCLFALFTLIF